MKIITSKSTDSLIKISVEGVQSIIKKNQYGKSFFVLYGNTFSIKNDLKNMGFIFFKGTWGKRVDLITEDDKRKLVELGADISLLDFSVDVAQEKDIVPVSELKEDRVPTDTEKKIEEMKDNIEDALKTSPGGKVRGLLSFIDKMIDRVAQLTDEASQSDFIKNFLAFSSKFHTYSFSNQMLIWIQKPSATYVKGHGQWMEIGREVVNWDNGIHIIAPRFRKIEGEPGNTDSESETAVYFTSIKVYDISDTKPIENWEQMKGKPVFTPPKLKTQDNMSTEEISFLVNALMGFIKDNNIDFDVEKMGEDLGGYSAGGQIRINDKYQGINLFSTMVHEVAHEIMHWAVDEENKKRIRAKEPRQFKEIDAETTAFIVLSHYGFESKDTPNYLALWKATGEDIKGRRENIQKSVKKIIDGIDSHVSENIAIESKNKIKIKLSKKQWQEIGHKVGWMKKAAEDVEAKVNRG